MKIIKAPERYTLTNKSIFLAGSIEMGKAENWQNRVINSLKDLDITILNPRRDDWNWEWKQTIDNPKFKEQVEWELASLEKATKIILYFDPNTKSPISLLEFGLFANSGKLIVCCQEGFWRKGNVDIVCNRYKIPMVENIEKLIEVTKLLL
jgi:hypothetical protein